MGEHVHGHCPSYPALAPLPCDAGHRKERAERIIVERVGIGGVPSRRVDEEPAGGHAPVGSIVLQVTVSGAWRQCSNAKPRKASGASRGSGEIIPVPFSRPARSCASVSPLAGSERFTDPLLAVQIVVPKADRGRLRKEE